MKISLRLITFVFAVHVWASSPTTATAVAVVVAIGWIVADLENA